MKSLLACFMLLAITACNTIDGMGQDIHNAGSAISNTAEKTKQKM